ncbi:MAG: rhamnulose-1-phosphate aldolase [Planctomycetota bacterium]
METLVDSLVRTARDLWIKGWAERNAGNVSLRVEPDVAVDAGPREEPWRPIGAVLPNLAGERFLFTGTGSFMRNIERDPERGIGLVEVDAAGESFRIAWGLTGGGLPTSELMPHLCAHAARMAVTGGADRAIIHTHPQNLIALTYALDLDTTKLTRLLWEMHTECIVVFPMGCGFVRWRMPGGRELAEATAEVLGRRTMAIWQHHGIVAAGPDLEHAFGLIETAEKAAEIYVKAAALGPVPHRLTTEQLTALAANFGVEPDREILGPDPNGV